jgi:hypothetical protein
MGAYLVSRGQRSTLGERGSAMDTNLYQTQQSTQNGKEIICWKSRMGDDF